MNKTKEIIIFKTSSGHEPYTEWFETLEISVQARILSRLERVEFGHYGDFKNLKDGVNELRFIVHKGYRIYFGENGKTIVILLVGGDKDSQNKDIQKAKEYWKEYLSREAKNNEI
jgi:putative addiction module killer protein